MKISINELFSPTVQGEGIHAGQRVGFIRLANCNLACSWCDTPYSWDWKNYDKDVEIAEMSTEMLAALVDEWDVDRIIITGGEPLLQQAALIDFMPRVHGVKFDIETNGTISPIDELVSLTDMFNVSPKLAHSGDLAKKRMKSRPLMAFANLAREGKATFKFVCQKVKDLDEVGEMVCFYDLEPSFVWIMPEGANIKTHLENLNWLADSVVEAGYNLTTRLHILAWGSTRAK